LQNALVSTVVALRNDLDRYLLIDRMELTPFTTNNITNYNSFLVLRRLPHLQGNEQFVSGRVFEMAERILKNLQKTMVDNTISTAAGLEKEVLLIRLCHTTNLRHIYRHILAKIPVTLRKSRITEFHNGYVNEKN
jgi:hypothetical protein